MPDEPRDPWEGTMLFPPSSTVEPDQPQPAPRVNSSGLEEHRAEIILTIAVISLFPIFGLIAIGAVWMAIVDLKKMSRGEMDPSGRTQTIVGLVIGAIELTVVSLALLYWLIHGSAVAAQ